MRLNFTQISCGIALALWPALANAEEVSLGYGELNLLADFIDAGDPDQPVALITHGTLAHKDMELIETLQEALAEQGVSSLAHTLSLNIDARRGMYDCAKIHTHRDEDADAEIAAWIDWLHENGHNRIALVGHSRGGKQVARTAANRDDLGGVVLIAPATEASAERTYKRAPTPAGSLLETNDDPPLSYVEAPSFLSCGQTQVTTDSLSSYYPDIPTGAETYVPDIAAPVLVIAGGKDTVVPEVPAVFLPLRSDTLQLALIEDADHMFLDFSAEDAATLIADFLGDLPEVTEAETEEPSPEVFAAADLAYGEYLGQECVSCHKADGAGSVPAIVGLEAWYTYLALDEYANGDRENDAMGLVARSLDEEQRISVASYFASLEQE